MSKWGPFLFQTLRILHVRQVFSYREWVIIKNYTKSPGAKSNSHLTTLTFCGYVYHIYNMQTTASSAEESWKQIIELKAYSLKQDPHTWVVCLTSNFQSTFFSTSWNCGILRGVMKRNRDFCKNKVNNMKPNDFHSGRLYVFMPKFLEIHISIRTAVKSKGSQPWNTGFHDTR